MQTELPAQIIVAIATVVAALIAAGVSFVNLTLNKELKTSEFRQAWIDGLREDLAAFFACARAFARASEEHKIFGSVNDNKTYLGISAEKVSEIRYQVAETRYRIQLRLNLGESEHKELFRLMQSATEAQQKMLQGQGDTAATMKAIEAAAEYAPQILKSEWERVKRGEFAFRAIRNWIAPAIFVLSLVFIFLVVSGKMKI
jgi:hypothetical protein